MKRLSALSAFLLLLSLPGCSGVRVEEGWTPLFNGRTLEGWRVTRFGGEGEVSVRDGAIILEMGETLTGITWEGPFPSIDYEIYLEAMRVRGTDFFCGLTFPVRDEYCSLIVGGWGGGLVGLSSLDGMDASENETTRVLKFERERWYPIRLQVTGQEIVAWIDGEQVIRVSTEDYSLSTRSEVSLSKPLGIASWVTRAALRDIRYRRLGGESVETEPPEAE